jgi:hypothetical protein
VRGDQRDYAVNGWKFGISVLETRDLGAALAVACELVLELRALKIERGGGSREEELDFAFLVIVDVTRNCSVLLICGGREYALASAAFKGCPFAAASEDMLGPGHTIKAEQTLCDIGPMVSRSTQLVPAFARVLSGDFSCHKERVSSLAYKASLDPADMALEAAIAEGSAEVTLDQQQNHYSRDYTEQLTVAIFGEVLQTHASRKKSSTEQVLEVLFALMIFAFAAAPYALRVLNQAE